MLEPRKRARMLVSRALEGGGSGGEQHLPTAIEIEHVGSFSKVVEGGGDGEQPPLSKSSALARFRRSGRWW